MSSCKNFRADKSGYYFSTDLAEIVSAREGEELPEAEHWEYLGDDSMTPSDAVTIQEERYPDVSVELKYRRI